MGQYDLIMVIDLNGSKFREANELGNKLSPLIIPSPMDNFLESDIKVS